MIRPGPSLSQIQYVKMFQLLGLLVLTVTGGMTQVDGAVNWYGRFGMSNTTHDSHAEYECSNNGGDRMVIEDDIDQYTNVFKNNALLNKQYWYDNITDQTPGVCWSVRYNGQMLIHTRQEGSSCSVVQKRYLCFRYVLPPPCLSGQVKRSALSGLCFQYIAEKMNMSEAIDHCTTLTGITGASGHIMEMTDVPRHKLAMAIDQDEQIWVGNMKNEAGDWIWVYSGSTLDDAQARWNPGEPSGDGDCVNTYLYDRKKWADTLCRINRAFICEFEARDV